MLDAGALEAPARSAADEPRCRPPSGPARRAPGGPARPGKRQDCVPGTWRSARLPSAPCRAARRPRPSQKFRLSSQDTGHGAAWNIPGSVDPMAKSTICAVESGRWWLGNVVFKTGESPSLKAGMKDGGGPRGFLARSRLEAASRRAQFFCLHQPQDEEARVGAALLVFSRRLQLPRSCLHERPTLLEPNLKLVLVLVYFLLIPHLPKDLRRFSLSPSLRLPKASLVTFVRGEIEMILSFINTEDAPSEGVNIQHHFSAKKL